MKKVISFIFLFLSAITILKPVNVLAYDIPVNACYLHVKDVNLGDVKIYIPCDESIKFSTDELGNYILVSSNAVVGYIDNDLQELVSFKPYKLGYYYDSLNGVEMNLNFEEVIENCNVNVIDKSSLFIDTNNDILSSSLLLFIGGSLWLLIFMKH